MYDLTIEVIQSKSEMIYQSLNDAKFSGKSMWLEAYDQLLLATKELEEVEKGATKITSNAFLQLLTQSNLVSK